MSETIIIVPKDGRDFSIARVTKFLVACMPGKRLRVTIEEDKATRTSQQNRYLNGVAYKILSDAIGYERDDVSEFCCGSYFGWVTVKCPKTPSNPEGVKDMPARTTTRGYNGERDVLKWDAFGDYVAWIQRFGARKGILIPDPDPEWFKNQDAQQSEAA